MRLRPTLLLCLFGVHRNSYAALLGWYPLFPVRCDDCHCLFYLHGRPEKEGQT